MSEPSCNTLLLTLWPPSAKYKILRRYADMFPAGRLAWASLQPCDPGVKHSFPHMAALPRQLHWRLRKTAAGWIYIHQFQAQRLAADIVLWAQAFNPRVLWVLPELGAAHVAPYVARALNIPMHVTSHDAHETARHIVPPLYYPCYAMAVRRIFRQATSVDAISEGLLEHLQKDFSNVKPLNSIVFHPSIDPTLIYRPAPVRDTEWENGRKRVIGLCGSMRISRQQWEEFLRTLSALPYQIELVSLAYRDRFFDSPLPENVTVISLPFAETECDIIRVFHERHVDACYLGLWRDPAQAFFGRTSLSAKLVTYAATSLPIIVDADQDSMAWRLVARHGAGIRLSGLISDTEELASLFRDNLRWRAMASASGRLCEAEFNQETNFGRFVRHLDRVVSGNVNL